MLGPGERGAARHALVLHPIHYRYTSAVPRTSPSAHLGHWYNTTILSKDDDIALGEQSSHRQGMGKGCVENRDTGKKHLNYLLASGQTLPNTFSIFVKREEKEQQGGGVDVLLCLPDTSLSLQFPPLLSVTSARRWALPQQGVTLQFPLRRGGKRLLAKISAL